ncbi:MAG: hypothetical protein GY869_00720, partial [Planctomycetes bacterium]|nr:hypothetical protein [Planctomycetota bacterium]
TSGAYDETHNGNQDVFVFKLNTSGSDLVYSTYIGGSQDDRGCAIQIDDTGNAYLVGLTASPNFPTTLGAYDESNNDMVDGFLVKLNPTGTSLDYSTFFGGDGSDAAYDLVLDGDYIHIIFGYARAGFPITANAYKTEINGQYDAAIMTFSINGNNLGYSTFIGGLQNDTNSGVVMDDDKNLYITGSTNSSDFPTTSGAFDEIYNGTTDYDAIIYKFNPPEPVDWPPSNPQNLAATPGDQQITLNWDRNSESDLHKYNIYRDTTSPAVTLVDSVVAASPPDTFFTDTGLTNGQIYYYRITAVDSAGNASSYSNEVSETPVDTTPPANPQNLNATAGDEQIDLDWDANGEPDLAKYRIYRDTVSPATTLVDSVVGAPPVALYSDTGLIDGQIYYYRITAVDNAGNASGYSNEVSETPVDETPPADPQNLSIHFGDEKILLIWSQNSDPDLHKYNIYGGTSPSPTTVIDSTVAASPPDTFYVDYSLNNGQIYYYRITAVDSSGN